MNNTKQAWKKYCTETREAISPILKKHGYTLDEHQPHIKGERYLMHAVTTSSGKKLILFGKDRKNARVVIKATRDSAGVRELAHERACRDVLKKINFAGDVFHIPEQVAYLSEGGYLISVQKFLEQQRPFLERPIEEQFDLALKAFKGQESAHATTFKHRRRVGKTFGIRDAQTYLENFNSFAEKTAPILPERKDLHTLFEKAGNMLRENEEIIEQYSGFLTHTDFVPHNIRVVDGDIYLLDQSSLTFGNKYEGWARFCNFMALYNPQLLDALVTYVTDNRSQEEYVSLRMMRIYRLGEIIWYYTDKIEKSTGDLAKLNTARVDFWTELLAAILSERTLSDSVLETYKKTRDSLRSADEKERQKGLH